MCSYPTWALVSHWEFWEIVMTSSYPNLLLLSVAARVISASNMRIQDVNSSVFSSFRWRSKRTVTPASLNNFLSLRHLCTLLRLYQMQLLFSSFYFKIHKHKVLKFESHFYIFLFFMPLTTTYFHCVLIFFIQNIQCANWNVINV